MSDDFYEYYAVYDQDTGAFLWRAMGPKGAARMQKVEAYGSH